MPTIKCDDPRVLLRRIINTPTPGGIGRNIRREPRKEQARLVRGLLTSLKIKGVSVTAPSYSMASSIHIDAPNPPPHEPFNDPHGVACPICRERSEAVTRLKEIILAGFPDMGDRSDSMTDYFDSPLSFR